MNNENSNNTSETLNAIMKQFVTINDTLSLFKMQISSLQQEVKLVEKNVRKEMKNITKDKKKEKMKSKRAPSGFAKPTKVTKELCQLARTEVTKALVAYIKTNNLFEEGEDTKKKIIPDEKLKNLLGIEDNDELNDLTYFNIQKYMNKHFYSNKLNNGNVI